MLPRELPAYKTVRSSFGLRVGTVFAPRTDRTGRKAVCNPFQRRFGIPQVSRKEKSRPQAALVDYFSSNEWITTPDRSLGSNHVVFGGMMLPVSAMLISCCIETG